MAVVLKASTPLSKGIVVFSHKERHWLTSTAPILVRALQRLREKYVICMHWGFHHTNVTPAPIVDLHIGRESTVTFDRPVRRLPMNSANFTPAFFQPRDLPKQWDVVSVTRTSKFKRTDQLLDTLRLALDARPDLSAMIICLGPREDRERDHTDLWKRYTDLFSPPEREQISFVLLRGDFQFPIARRDIAHFYNCSRIFTLFSEYEGESRVIKEALLCGLPVLLRKELVGGGLDFLDATAMQVFSTTQEAAAGLVEMLNNLNRFTFVPQTLARSISETHSIPRFESAMTELFAELEIPFAGDIDTDDLSRKLPSHTQSLPRDLCLPLTDDLRDGAATVRFVYGLIDETRPLQHTDRVALQWHTRIAGLRRLTSAVMQRLKADVR